MRTHVAYLYKTKDGAFGVGSCNLDIWITDENAKELAVEAILKKNDFEQVSIICWQKFEQ